jgi:hypothetical protein
MTKGGKRKGAGRPAKYGEPVKQYNIWWPPSAWEVAGKEAKEANMSRSEFILRKVFE